MLVLLRVKGLWDFLLVLGIGIDEFQHAIELPLVCGCFATCNDIGSALVEVIAYLSYLRV